MQGIQMVNLKKQYEKIKDEIDKGIASVIESTAFINGPDVNHFARELETYLGVKHVIPCANGTDALQIALMALGLKPGDEVITPSFTFIATVEVVALMGLKPVFADVDIDTFVMDPESVRKAITPHTKAIIPVHLYGQCADMEQLLKIAQEHNLFVIEDNAQAIGGHYIFPNGSKAMTGTMGHIGTTSFFPSKNLGCYGDGGAIFTNDPKLAETLKKIANHGQSIRYYHDIVGVNSRLDSIQAAVLRVKLKHLDEYCAARRKAADFYDAAFAGNPYVTTPVRAQNGYHVFHQYTVKLDNSVNRDKVIEAMSEKGIPTMIYYPVPCHKQKMLEEYTDPDLLLPVTDALNGCVMSLPIHTELTDEELNYIADQFNVLTQEHRH